MSNTIVEELTELLGVDATLLLMKHYAGTRFYVPEKASVEHIIAKKIGYDNMKNLCYYYGRQSVFIPISKHKQEERRRIVAKLSAEGVCNRDIALLVGCTEHTIITDKRKMKEKEDARWIKMFD